uniref:Uncharacterized protein n=1 Tax=Timema shepardi TaxID=629360 RepID=A0A7R9AZD0_TIMSH|nr:unnamed protein product [Timema shepardi]
MDVVEATEPIPGQRLRITNNGAILHSGGTISGRKQGPPSDSQLHSSGSGVRAFRSRSNTQQQRQPPAPINTDLGYNGKRFGSEPDLRFPVPDNLHDSPAKQRITRTQQRDIQFSKMQAKHLSRKKYKAPAPPPEGESPGMDSSSPDSYQWESSGPDPPMRRMRLFKTRAETKKSLAQGRPEQLAPTPSSPSPAQRSLASQQFQEELLKAAQRLRPTGALEQTRERSREAETARGEGSGQESTPEPVRVPSPVTLHTRHKHWEILPPASRQSVPFDRDTPVKTFYFGMEQSRQEVVDRFAARLQHPATPVSQESLRSSDSEQEEGGGIALALRPTLPKKQLEIPRFSPTAAWRLLSALNSGASHIIYPTIEETPVVLEERPIVAPRSSLDKSADSGISGDASPGGQDAWTPQQDLEEESSSDGEHGERLPVRVPGSMRPTFSPRAVFSLSLPREDQLCLALYSDQQDGLVPKVRRDVPPSFNSLKKLKRTMSGAFKRREEDADAPLDENWVLSRSVPNSLHTSHQLVPWEQEASIQEQSSSSPSSPDRPSFSYLATGGHIMYLPQIDSKRETLAPRERSYSAGPVFRGLSKSCENISASEMRQLGRTPSPQRDQPPDPDPPTPTGEERQGKGRRFTFQSTVRQIERRRLAERLSREADMKEQRRLGELEAMRRVEEEFQRKRAREKANIRQQLRLFHMDESQQHASLPTHWGDARAEPDGAPSPTPARPVTQVLSEFREARREYRDFRHARCVDSGPESLVQLDHRRSTVHPKAVYDMPKSTQVYINSHPAPDGRTGASTPRSSSSDNYRREFAHGARPVGRSVASSDSEMSTQSPSRQGHEPVQRLRARPASPNLTPSPYKTPDTLAADTEPVTPTTQLSSGINTLQPFARNQKGYRPIVFNPTNQASHTFAQIVS